jgi:monoterpene epsilon-lactone hydrolase
VSERVSTERERNVAAVVSTGCSEEYETIVAGMASLPLLAPEMSVVERRAQMERMAAVPPPEGVAATVATVGGVAGEWVEPPGAGAGRALLWLHGGAYCIGSPATHRRHAAMVGLAAGARVFVADYRLAPEHPFPAALDDALAAYRGLVADHDPGGVVVIGDSAGGGLTAALLVALRDGGEPLPAGAVMLSPWADLTLAGESWRTRAAVDPLLDEARLREAAGWYAGDRALDDPLVSPVFADLAGLPPLFVSAGDRETLRDDAELFAARARAAGVDVVSEIVPGMVHVFHALAGMCPEGDAANERIAAFVRDRLGR